MKLSPCNDVDASIINAATAVLNCEVAGMQAQNSHDELRGRSPMFIKHGFDMALKRFEDSIAGYIEPDNSGGGS